MRTSRIVVAGFVVAMLACADGERAPTPETGEPSAAANRPALAGGPGPLVAEIRAGIRDLPTEVEADPVAARRRAVDLYATRQEALERGWGRGGSAGPDSTLAAAVLAAEASFHELLALLNRTAAPEPAEVAEAVAALERRLVEVERAAGGWR